MKRIFFMGFIVVDGCNPNGDPATGNRPRIDYAGHGEISSVSIKRKIRDALYFSGKEIFVRDPITDDGFSSQRKRAGTIKTKTTEEFSKKACEKWIDVRLFGQVFHLPKKIKNRDGIDAVSIGVRGPATISQARSVEEIEIETQTIANAEDIIEPKAGKAKSSMSFGTRHLVWRAAYCFSGGVSPQLAHLTGATDSDVEALKNAILSMYHDGASSTRPDGSICLHRLLWWEMEGIASPAKILRSVSISPAENWPYYTVKINSIPGAKQEEYVL